MPTSWNDDEEAALMYLPHRAQVLYLRGLRQFMDYATGIVGDRRRVSLQQMRECLEVTRPRGSHLEKYKPTNHEIRASLAQLEMSGLIKRLEKPNKLAPMRFLLPLASIRLNEEPPMYRKCETASRSVDGSSTYEVGTDNVPQGMNRIPPLSGKSKTPVLPAREASVDNSAVPSERSAWGRVLADMGFRQEQIFSAKNLAMFQIWIEQRVTVGEFKQAATVAHARNHGMPANVAYYGWSVREIIKQRERTTHTGGGYEQSGRVRESGAAILARGCAKAFEPD